MRARGGRGGRSGRGAAPAVAAECCELMCSAREARERESCLEVNRLEQLAGTESQRRPSIDPALAVKRYQRPAAGAPPGSAAVEAALGLGRIVALYHRASTSYQIH